MPHIAVKAFPGKTDAQKQEFANAIVREAQRIFGSSLASLSVGIEDIAPELWAEQVYGPDIAAKWDTLRKQPGYGPGPTR